MVAATGIPTSRLVALDALRGAAMVWMTAYHLAFDLQQFGLLHQNFYLDSVWTVQRSCIVGLFLFCAGWGQAIAHAQGVGWNRFGRRWMQIAGCAALVSVSSWWMFPHSWIYFGVLHGMAVMLLLVRWSIPWGYRLWWCGAAVVAVAWVAPQLLSAWASDAVREWLHSPLGNWLGWITHKPITEDYVPLFPWLGVMWWGAALGSWLGRRPTVSARLASVVPQVPGVRGLAFLGRWSLSYYMLHQPILLGCLFVLLDLGLGAQFILVFG
ncbi:DUF1624 domain-containing protein [Candidatus Symbiobacter mobilis]|uniref:Heparan-alpha-glucosaminide N-acetyltransferase catalytic domain-containing protein n=1 Tax=Candidatus Symbiobacter mobilis CR TaxID=946483 RepID=U5N739_9BURK|nr:heparan-alpha-glucosaminide N-acetyltransferase [Candidatus Symbiobacter mobilis]AGX87115.1 hypothetical protein Cenrod_1017 [Candidatus Symbiobacter mobilis CR]